MHGAVGYSASFRGAVNETERQSSVELRLTKNIGSIDILLGLYYFDYTHRIGMPRTNSEYVDRFLMRQRSKRVYEFCKKLPCLGTLGFMPTTWIDPVRSTVMS